MGTSRMLVSLFWKFSIPSCPSSQIEELLCYVLQRWGHLSSSLINLWHIPLKWYLDHQKTFYTIHYWGMIRILECKACFRGELLILIDIHLTERNQGTHGTITASPSLPHQHTEASGPHPWGWWWTLRRRSLPDLIRIMFLFAHCQSLSPALYRSNCLEDWRKQREMGMIYS